MFQQILVPLDGSRLAESVLPAAACLAEIGGGRAILVHIIEQDAAPTVHGQPHLIDPDEAGAYLDEIARRAFPATTPTSTHVHTAPSRDVARAIVAHQEELTPDLIVMCRHGAGDLRRMLVGSIAQQVVAGGTTPVLLVPPAAGAPVPFHCRCLLAPLDGDPEHEQGLVMAAELARTGGARLLLLSVVPTRQHLAGRQAAQDRFLPGTTRGVLDQALADRQAYLERQVERLRAEGIAVTGEIRAGDAATQIAAAAAAARADVIVLGTHGRAGARAFWTNSTTARVCAQVPIPLLLVPVTRAADPARPGSGAADPPRR
jgi:nucleotide-binding universal stress UspA family protein